MSELRNCRECGKLFVGATPVCPDCRRAEDHAFDQVRAYLDEHPAASVAETAGATGVALALVHRFVEDGRLVMQGAGAVCRVCGAPVVTGRLCPDCQEELRRAQARAARGAKAHPGGFYSRPAGS
jgi:predicted amidophosphoribosyltransferase